MTALRNTIERNRRGEAAALASVCSAHPTVLRASLSMAERLDRPIVVEATSNQVNQFGGYTGMRAEDFLGFVRSIAVAVGCDADRIVLGGDHLGPQAWRHEAPAEAMAKARRLVADYAQAGFAKLHLDCAEGCLGEAEHAGDDLAASRAAELAGIALDHAPDPDSVDFIVGTEVPPPGGARGADMHVEPTRPDAARRTLEVHKHAFAGNAGRIRGLVVQPGVEFSNWEVAHLPEAGNHALRQVLDDHPGICFEAHSTDYQRPDAYPRLASQGFAVLKVGPALTFAFREAVYRLDLLAGLLSGDAAAPSVRDIAEAVMTEDTSHWRRHFEGDAEELRLLRHFSYSDRIRYYWPQPRLGAAVAELMATFESMHVPRAVLTQVFAEDVIDRAGNLTGARSWADALVLATIERALAPYFVGSAA